MERDMNEVLQSQQIMLGKKSDKEKKNFPLHIAQAFQKQVAKMDSWIESQPNVEILRVNHREAIEDSAEVAKKVGKFLNKEFDFDKMAASVDKSLYRNRN